MRPHFLARVWNRLGLGSSREAAVAAERLRTRVDTHFGRWQKRLAAATVSAETRRRIKAR